MSQINTFVKFSGFLGAMLWMVRQEKTLESLGVERGLWTGDRNTVIPLCQLGSPPQGDGILWTTWDLKADLSASCLPRWPSSSSTPAVKQAMRKKRQGLNRSGNLPVPRPLSHEHTRKLLLNFWLSRELGWMRREWELALFLHSQGVQTARPRPICGSTHLSILLEGML